MSTRRRPFRRWLWYAVGGLVLIGGTVAVLDFSPVVRIHGVDVAGARSVSTDDVTGAVAAGYDRSIFGMHYRIPSLVNLDTGKARASLIAAFPQIADATVSRDWPHRVAVTVTERVPRGSWCRSQTCTFWDETGVRWGASVPSVGPLLLLVRDERTDDGFDDRLRAGMLAAVNGLPAIGLSARTITLPDAEPGGMRITVDRGYELYLDALGEVEEQLDTLRIFLTDKAKDGAFKPAYIDLRTPGRVYFH